jgi:hypothetical protein
LSRRRFVLSLRWLASMMARMSLTRDATVPPSVEAEAEVEAEEPRGRCWSGRRTTWPGAPCTSVSSSPSPWRLSWPGDTASMASAVGSSGSSVLATVTLAPVTVVATLSPVTLASSGWMDSNRKTIFVNSRKSGHLATFATIYKNGCVLGEPTQAAETPRKCSGVDDDARPAPSRGRGD